MAEHGWLGPIEWAAESRPLPGENICGDRSIAVDVNGTGALFGVVDGIGHGTEAAEAANCCVDVLAMPAPSRSTCWSSAVTVPCRAPEVQ